MKQKIIEDSFMQLSPEVIKEYLESWEADIQNAIDKDESR